MTNVRAGKKRTLERNTLHSQLQVGVCCFFSGDLESVHVEQANLLVDDNAPVRFRDTLPYLVCRASVALYDEDSFFESTLALVLDDKLRRSMAEEGRSFSLKFEKRAVCQKMLENYSAVTDEFSSIF